MATQKQWDDFLKKLNQAKQETAKAPARSDTAGWVQTPTAQSSEAFAKSQYKQKLIAANDAPANNWVSGVNQSAYKQSQQNKATMPKKAKTAAPMPVNVPSAQMTKSDWATPANVSAYQRIMEQHKANEQKKANTKPSTKENRYTDRFMLKGGMAEQNALQEARKLYPDATFNSWEDLEGFERAMDFPAQLREIRLKYGDDYKLGQASASAWNQYEQRENLLAAADEETQRVLGMTSDTSFHPELVQNIINEDNAKINIFEPNAALYGTYQQNADVFEVYEALNRSGVIGNIDPRGYDNATIQQLGLTDMRDAYITQEQLMVFNHYVNSGQYDAAREYLSQIRLGADVRYTENESAELEEYALDNPVLAFLKARWKTLESAANAIPQQLSARLGGNTSVYSPLYQANMTNSVITGTQSDAIRENVGGVVSFLYNTGTSMVDNMLASIPAVLTGNPALTMLIMGSEAASADMYNQMQMGVDPTSAANHAAVTGFLEFATEKLGVDALLGDPKGAIGKYLLKNAGAEAVEEGITGAAAPIVDWIFDGYNSPYWRAVVSRVADGEDIETAKRNANMTTVKDIGEGMLSGFISGGGQAAINIATHPGSLRSIRTEGAQTLLERNREITETVKANEARMQEEGVSEQEAETLKAQNETLISERTRNTGKVEELIAKINGTPTKAESGQKGSVSNPEVEKGLSIKGMDKDGNFIMSDDSSRGYADVDLTNMPDTAELAAEALHASEDYGVSPGVYYGSYRDGVNVEQYNYAARAIMSAGYAGGSLSAVMDRDVVSNAVPQEMAEALYVAAANRGKADTDSSRLNAKLATPMPKDGAVTVDDDAMAALLNDDKDSTRVKLVEAFTDMSAAGVFKSSGLKIEFFAGKANADGVYESAQGSYNPTTNTIRVDINAGRNSVDSTASYAVGQVVSHELTHAIKAGSPKQFSALQTYVADALAKRGESLDAHAQQIMSDYAKAGNKIDISTAMEEVVAQACEMALRDSQFASNLVKSNRTLAEKIRDIIKDIAGKIKAAFSGSRHITDMSKAMENDMAGLVEIWDRALAETLGTETEATEAETVETTINEATEGAVDASGNPLFSLRTMREDIDVYREMLTKHGQRTDAQVDTLISSISGVMDYIDMHRMVLDFGENIDSSSRPFKPVKPNSDPLYEVSVDFSTLCRKRLLQQAVQERLEKMQNKALTKAERIAVRQALMDLRKQGMQIEVACALCYVESTRLKAPQQIERFMGNREKILNDYFATKDSAIKVAMDSYEAAKREELGVGNASLKALPGAVAKQIRAAKKQALADYKVSADQQRIIDLALDMTVSDFTSADALWTLKETEPELFDCFTSYIRNATKSKGVEGDTPWKAGDSAEVSDALIEKMNAENGLRSQSWSDFQAYHILDYVGAIIELSTRNAKMQSYTKVPDYIRLMGRTGMMINQSLIPAAKWSGTLEYDPIEGIDYQTALALREEYPDTAGTICIGINDEQIRMLLADDTIDMVIPYHKSSMDKVTRQKMNIPGWQDHEATQNEKAIPGKTAGKATKFSDWFDYKTVSADASQYGAQEAMRRAAQKYLDLCAERNLQPKFPQFASEANYWKLLIDRKMINQKTGQIIDQKAVQPNFSLEDMLTVCKNEVSRFEESNRDFSEAVDIVVDMFQRGEIANVAKSQKVQDKLIAAENWMTVQAAVNSQTDSVNPQSEEKYSLRTEAPLTDREIVGEAMNEVATTNEERLYLARYKKVYSDWNTESRKQKKNRNESRLANLEAQLKKMEADEKFGTLLEAEKARAEAAIQRDYESGYSYEQDRADLIRGYEARLQKKRRNFEEYKADRKESATRAKYLERVEREANALTDLLTTNTDKKHVPEALKGPLGEFLRGLNRWSKTLNEKASETGKDRKLSGQMLRLKDALEKVSLRSTNEDGSDSLYLPDDVPQLLQKCLYHIMEYEEAHPDANPVYAMSNDDLKQLSDVLRILHRSIAMANRAFATARNRTIDMLAQITVAESEELGKASKNRNQFTKHFAWDMALPVYAFDRMGGAAAELFDALRSGAGQNAQRDFEVKQFAEEKWTQKELEKWSRAVETYEVETTDGYTETIEMTDAQKMSLYLLLKRPQAVEHIKNGGLIAGTVKVGSKYLVEQTEPVRITLDEARRIANTLDDRQIEVCNAMAEFLKKTSDWGNEVSMARFGYNAFAEKNYFPIRTDDNSRNEMDETVKGGGTPLYRLLNMSFTKALTDRVSNALVLDNAFEVFTNHAMDMSKYSTMALPVLDTIRWMNHRGEYNTRVALQTAFGKEATDYLKTFITDLSGATQSGERTHLADWLVSNAKAASVLFNTSVVLKQRTSIFRAAALMPKIVFKPHRISTVAGLFQLKDNYEEMLSHSGIARRKSLGYFDPNVGRSLAQTMAQGKKVRDKIVEWGGFGAELMDNVTFVAIWNEAKSEVGRKIQAGTQEYWDAVTKRFEDVIYKTQVVDSVMTKSQQMRSKSWHDKAITSFMAEPVLGYNVVMDALSDCWKDIRRNGKITRKSGVKLALNLNAWLSPAIFTAIITAFVSAYRDEDDYKTFGEKYFGSLFGEGDTIWQRIASSDVASALNPFEAVPYLSDIISGLKGEDSSIYGSALNQLYKAYTETKKLIAGDSAASWEKVVAYDLRALSTATGTPLYNLFRDAYSAWNTTVGTHNPRLKFRVYGSSASEGYEAYYDAILAGDTDEMKRLEKVMEINKRDNGKTHLAGLGDGLTAIVKKEYMAGALPYDKAEEILITYCGRTKTGSKSAYHDIAAWEYKAATNETSYSMYTPLRAALIAGDDKAVQEAYGVLETHYDKSEKDVDSQIASIIRDAFEDGDIDRETAEKRMRQYTDKNARETREYLDREGSKKKDDQ